jgi:hypothetical protein
MGWIILLVIVALAFLWIDRDIANCNIRREDEEK